MDLKDKIVLVTGSAERVGKAISLRLAARGAQTIIHYRTKQEKAEQAAAEIASIGKRPLLIQGDVSKGQTWERFRLEITDAFGRLDVLINNAAVFYKTPFFQSTEDDWDHFMDVNLKSVYLGCRILGEMMQQQGSGKIINIADVSAERIWPSYIPYCVSKAGVVAITRGLAKALAPNITVNAIAPGTVLLADQYNEAEERELIEKTPLRRVGSAEDIAAAAEFLLEGSDFVTGSVINVDGGRSLV